MKGTPTQLTCRGALHGYPGFTVSTSTTHHLDFSPQQKLIVLISESSQADTKSHRELVDE
jgi:hypothetical protein